ncbi:MAG TPA: hypothetical protein VK963_00395 [Candidatus Saccharimonadales bacterium]|nr:hypothetical protein [Candidatus Saccharimonadales bacterium]
MSGGELAYIIIGVALFSICLLVKKVFERRGENGKIFLIPAIVALLAGGLGFGLERADRLEIERATAQVHQFYGPVAIRDLSISGESITYEKNGKLCTTKLFQLRGRYFIAEEGAQCADLER